MKKRILIIVVLSLLLFTSWDGINMPTKTIVREITAFQGKTNVLQISPANNGYDYYVFTHDLGQYSGKRITINISMQVWLESPAGVLWQLNTEGYPWIAGSSFPLSTKRWHTVQGTHSVTVGRNYIIYLTSNGFNNTTAYIADLSITINDNPVVIDNSVPALHTKWPFLTGAEVPPVYLNTNTPEHSLLRHFNIYVSGFSMEAASIMPDPWTPNGAYRWTQADSLLKYADRNNKKIRSGFLFYHSLTPEAFFKGSGRDGRATINELYTRMERHARTVFKKYGGKIEWWDVCNEALSYDGTGVPNPESNYTRIMDDAGKTGMNRYEYILKAFQFARQYADANRGQNVNLYIAETDIEFPCTKQTSFLNLLDYLIANNAPIDGVAIQGHIRFTGRPSVKDFSEAIDAVTAKKNPVTGRNLVVSIRELDMGLFTENEENWNSPHTSRALLSENDLKTRLIQQTARYRELFDMFEQKYNEGKLDMVLFWGIDDGNSWLNYFKPPFSGREDHPLLFDRNLQPKAAFHELIRSR